MPQDPRDSLFGPDDPFSASAQAQSAARVTDSLFAPTEDADRAFGATLRQPGDAGRAERILKLQTKTGLPAPVIDRNLDEIEKKAAAQDFNPEKLRAETPALAAWLQEEPQRAALKQEDLAHMGALEYLFTAQQNAFKRSVNTENYSDLRFQSWWRPLTKDEQTAMQDYKTASEMPIGDDSWWRKIYAGFGGLLGQQRRTAEYAFKGYGVGAATGIVTAATLGPGAVVGGVTVPAMATGGAAVGAQYGMATSTFQQEAVAAYDELEQAGIEANDPIDPRVLKAVALGVGAVNTAIEMEAQNYVWESIPAVRNLSRRWAMNKAKAALANPSARAALGKMVAQFGKNFGVEVGQEVVQQIFTIGFEEAGKVGTNVPHRTVEKGTTELVNTAINAAQEFALYSAFGPGAQGIHDYRQARAGEQLLDNIGSVAKDAKLLKNLPNQSQDFLARAAAMGTDTVYAPLPVWNEYWEQQKQDPAEVARDLTGSDKAYDAAVKTSNEVAIPIANWAVRAAPEHSDFWRRELRYGENKMNAREADEWLEELRAQREAEIEAGTAQPIAPDVQGRLAEGMTTQLQAAGRDEEEARTQGHIFASQVMALSNRYGIDPEAMASRYGVTISTPPTTAAPEAALSQQARAQTATPEFQQWFGESQVRDEQGAPLVVYHGSNQRFTEFDRERAGTKTDSGYLGRGFYFGDRWHAGMYAHMSREQAQDAAGDQEHTGEPYVPVGAKSALYPVYLSLKNPLVLDEQRDPDHPNRTLDREKHIRAALGLDASASADDVTRAAEAAGYDGVVFNYENRGKGPFPLDREYVAFRPEQIKSAIGNRGTFDPNSPNILHQGEAPGAATAEQERALDTGPAERKDGALLVSTRKPSTAATTPVADVLLITNLDALTGAGPDKVAQAAAAFRSYQLLTPEQRAETDDNVLLRSAIDAMKRNLKALWDKYPEEWRNRAKLWYVGANRIANELSLQFGYSVDAVAGVLAALSPQMDWFRNVSLAERVIKIVKQFDAEDAKFTQEHYDQFEKRHAVATAEGLKDIRKTGPLRPARATVKVGDQSLSFTLSDRASKAKDELVRVDLARLEQLYAAAGGVDEEQGAEIGDASKLEAPEVTLTRQGAGRDAVWTVTFTNGRQLFQTLRDQGVETVPVALSKDSIKQARKKAKLLPTGAIVEPTRVRTPAIKEKEQEYLAERQQELDEIHAIIGRMWKSLPEEGQARFLRVHDELHNERTYDVISPEGDRVGLVRTKEGKDANIGWGTYGAIENAISILHNASPGNISDRLGGEHKVRSFYNNISHPWDGRSITVDTHAVAAAFLEPFSGAAREVMHTMGSKPKGDPISPPDHKASGISGINAVIAQAYFELADELGVLPRELQSVTWEAIRSLYRPEQKRAELGKALVAKIGAIASRYGAGELSHEEYVDAIFAAATPTGQQHALEVPAWANVPVSEQGRVGAEAVHPRSADVSAGRGDRGGDTGGLAGGGAAESDGVIRGAATAAPTQVSQEGGRLAQGVAHDYAALTEKLLADGGFTYAPLEGVYRTEGMALSIFPERAVVFEASEATVGRLAQFVRDNRDLFQQGGNHFGAWYDKDGSGKVYLDVSRIVATREEAQALGQQHEQIAYFDLNTFETVPVEYPEDWTHGPTWQGTTTAATGGSADAGGTGGNVEGVNGPGSDTGGTGGGAGGTGRLGQGERGYITWGPDLRLNIGLLKDADSTTGIHELGHFAFLVMGDLVEDLSTRVPTDLTPQQQRLVADYNTLLKFVGAESRAALTEQHHETLARGFEAYIMEGKAPSQELRGAFARLRAMFLQVYKTLGNLNVELSDDVRRVFDRMLASDEAIAAAEAERGMQPTFLTAAQAGMDEATWALYKDRIAEASRVAREELDQQLLAEVKREQSALYAKREAEVRAEVEATVHTQPVYRAITAMQTGLEPGQSATDNETAKPLKLSKDIIVERYGAERLKTLPRPYIYTKTGGMDPDAVAEFYGFSSGDDLLTHVASVPKMQDAIDQQVQARMQAESGSILTDATLQPRAQAAVANEHRAEIIRLELRTLFDLRRQAAGEVALERKERAYERRWNEAEAQLRIKIAEARQQGITSEVRAEKNAEIDALEKEVSRLKAQARRGAARINEAVPDQETINEAARQRLAGMVIQDIRPQVFWNAALRAGREATEFAARQQFDPFQTTRTTEKQGTTTLDYDGAIKAKTQQLLNLSLYRQAIALQAEVEKRARFARSLASGPARAQLGKAGHTYLDQADAINDQYEFARVSQTVLDRRASFAKWLDALQGQGMPVPSDLPTDLLESRGRRNYRTLTTDEFMGVTDGLKAIVHLAKLKNKLLTVQDKKDFEASRDDLVGSIRAHGTAKTLPAEPTAYEKAMTGIAWTYAQLRRMSAIAQAMDGYVDGGTVWSYFVRPMNERQAWKEDRNREAGKALTEIDNRFYTRKEQGRFSERTTIQAIGTSLSKTARLQVALNWGNEGGRDRLTTVPDTDPNRSWSRAQVEAILDTLDERDWKYVQAVWDYIDTYWSEIADKQQRVTGVRPEKVEAVPVLTKFGTFPGGYFPLKYDAEHNDKGTSHAKADQALSLLQASYTASTTRRGHVQARAEHVGRALRLDGGVLYEHIGQVIHDLAFHETLSDVQRLLQDPEVRRAIKETQGKAVVEEFEYWLEDIATDTLGGGGRSGFMEKAAQFAKTRTQIQGLAYNLWTMVQQPIGIINGMARVGPYWVMHGMNRWFRDTATLQSTVQFVWNKSAVMRNRMDNGPELADLRAKLAVRGGWADKAVRAVTNDHLTYTALLDSFTWHIGQAQRIADMPTWLGQYSKSLHAGETEDRAIAIADQAVLDSQGGGAIKDMARIERGHPAVRAFLLFYSYGNMMLNATARAVGKTDFKSPVQVLEFMGQLGLLYVVPSMIQVLLAQASGKDEPPDDDEPWAQWFLEQVTKVSLAQGMNTIPVLREAQSWLQRTEGNARYGGPAFTRIVKETYDLGNQVAQGDLDAALFKAVTGVAGFAAGIPTAPAQKAFDGYVALSEGRTHNPLVLIFGPPKE